MFLDGAKNGQIKDAETEKENLVSNKPNLDNDQLKPLPTQLQKQRTEETKVTKLVDASSEFPQKKEAHKSKSMNLQQKQDPVPIIKAEPAESIEMTTASLKPKKKKKKIKKKESMPSDLDATNNSQLK